MTLALRRGSLALQLVGLTGSVLGLAASIAFQSYCTGGVMVGAGIAAVALDLIAVRARSSPTILLAAVAKPIAVYLFTGIVFSCAAPRVSIPEPLLPTSTGFALLAWSSIPTVVGAILRRSSR